MEGFARKKLRRGSRAGSTQGGLWCAVVATAAVLTTVAPAVAASEFEKFDARIGKVATKLATSPRGTCVCQDGGPLDGATGILVRFPEPREFPNGDTRATLVVECVVPGFDPAGASVATFVCTGFDPLPR